MKRLVLAGIPLALLVAWSRAAAGPGERMAAAARAFLAALTDEQRARAAHPFDSPARTSWHFFPRQREGIRMGELSEAQRAAAHELLQSALSARGEEKVQGVILLEGVLYELESRPDAPASGRDPGNYTVAVWGEPAGGKPWGWRIEGHHLSLNFNAPTGALMASTPAFLGATPARVSGGKHDGLRVLAAEEDLARELVASFSPEQRAQGVRAAEVPADVVFGPDRAEFLEEPQGLEGKGMDEGQRARLLELIEEYVGNMEGDVARRERERIAPVLDGVRFLWIGSEERGKPHYYRIHGAHFVVEYDNVQGGANHAHSLWRDLKNDFGRDDLLRHREQGHR